MASSKLLLADDSITIQKVVNLTFADEGIEVISVGDGNSAMEKFVEISPDLVMADVNMPGIDGYRICEMIKQDAGTKDVPVVLLVGSFEPFDEEEAKRVGANDYLTKPFQSIRQLVEKVSDLLSQARVDRVSFAKPREEAATDLRETVTAADADSSVETIEAHRQESAVENKFGDPGMDDEMIQTNQVGSLPVDEVQRFESFHPRNEEKNDEFPAEFRDVEQHQYEISEGAAETKPLSQEEFEEISTESVGETEFAKEEIIYEPADDAGEPSLEQMPEIEFNGESTEAEDTFVPTIVPTEQYFQPDEVDDEEQISVEEMPSEKSFEFEALSPEKEIPTAENVRGFEILPDNEKVQEEKVADEPEITAEKEPPQPGFIDKLRHIFRDKEEMTSIVDTSEPAETETVGETPEFVSETEFTEPEAAPSVSEVSETSPPEIVEIERETQPAETETFEAETPQPEVENQILQPEPEVESQISQPETIETEQEIEFQSEEIEYSGETTQPEIAEFEPEEVIQTESAEEVEEISAGGQEFAEPEAAFEESEIKEAGVVETAEVAKAEGVAEAKQERAAFEEEPPLEIEEKAEEKTGESPAEEVEVKETKTTEKKIIDLDEANLLEIAPGEKISPIKSMISSELREEKADSGESMIVSEYARQSISLSSEAIDMIADRVADKIAEKVIRELSSEIVSDLADLVVERMERKQLE